MKRVTVVMGSNNSEREVSLISGKACSQALEEVGYHVEELDVREPDWIKILIQSQPDIIFNALHGKGVEDGKIQGVFEHLGISYTHSGVLASAIGMDKSISKALFQRIGLPVAPYVVAPVQEAAQRHMLEPPYVIKPLDQGSSVGITLVREKDEPPAFLATPRWAFGPWAMIEKYIPGIELTCGILHDEPFGILDIHVTHNAFYDYEAKYALGASHHEPARLSTTMHKMVEQVSLHAHKALKCRGVTRCDFRLDPTQGEKGLYLLEINTQPGMTPTSLIPEMAMHRGMSYTQLVDWIARDASHGR